MFVIVVVLVIDPYQITGEIGNGRLAEAKWRAGNIIEDAREAVIQYGKDNPNVVTAGGAILSAAAGLAAGRTVMKVIYE